tara:strand:+ start:93 stop:929 length:837 start_codon:yes stop_codon:yes gene_type:complete
MRGFFCSCGSLEVLKQVIETEDETNVNDNADNCETKENTVVYDIEMPNVINNDDIYNLSQSMLENSDNAIVCETVVSDLTDNNIESENTESEDTDINKKKNLDRFFQENEIFEIYYQGAKLFSMLDDNTNKNYTKLYDTLLNKNMWLIVFDKLCVGFLLKEMELKRIDYFNEMITNNMIMDNVSDEIKNFGDYTIIGDEPIGANIYVIRMDSPAYLKLSQNITIEKILETLSIIRNSSLITDYSYNKLDKYFMETFFGFTSETDLFESFQKYVTEKEA